MKPLLFALSMAALCVAGCQRAPEAAPPPEKVTFPIGGYSGDPERDAAAGFTLAGPVYAGQREEFAARCAAAKLPFFQTIGVEVDFLGKKGEPPTELDWEAIRKEVQAQVAAAAENPLIHAWYLTPEELRYWKPLEMEYLKVVSEAITAADPQKRRVWMYEPGHRTQSAMEKIVPYLTLVGKGVYPNYSGRGQERAWVGWTIGQQAAAIKAVNPGAEPYAILEMFKKPDEAFEAADIRRWVRHDAYASLVGGARGIVIFSFGRRAGFHPETPEWQAYYKAWSGVARELNGPDALGSVFLTGEPVAAPAFRMVEGEERATFEVGKKEAPVEVPTVTTAAYRWGGQRVWCVVNSSQGPVRLALEAPQGKWQPVLEGQPEVAGGELRLPGLGVAIFRQGTP